MESERASSTNVKPLSEVEGQRIDQAYLGSCASGRLEDIAAAARVLKGRRVHPEVRFIVTPGSREILRADEVDSIYYQVLGNRGELLSGEPNLPLPDESETMTVGTVRLRDDRLSGNVVRVAYVWVQPDPLSATHSLVQVAETLEKRSVLAREIIQGVMLPLFVILPLAVLLVWLALARGIQPLNQLEEDVCRNPT